MPEYKKGYCYAIAAFFLWGLFPLYFKEISHIGALEVLSNRIIWALVSLVLLLVAIKNWSVATTVLLNKKYWLPLGFSTVFISVNWGIYIWSVETNRIVEASLGYYINPLVNILLGYLFLQERLRWPQKFAVLLAVIGVGIQFSQINSFPWIALALAFSFGFYGLIHKKMSIDSISGLFVETLILFPAAIAFLFYASQNGEGIFLWSTKDWWFLVIAGPVTVVPLLLFTAATKRISYSTIGFIQYIGPSLLFLLAVFVYDEPMTFLSILTFIFIWVALVIISLDALNHKKKQKNDQYYMPE